LDDDVLQKKKTFVLWWWYSYSYSYSYSSKRRKHNARRTTGGTKEED
jgi:hypothetical protein